MKIIESECKFYPAYCISLVVFQDLFSILIYGPADTPYEDGLFLFDLHLPADYPKSPPTLHYVSQCTGRLNPNLYEDGTVCVSLLGTWNGKGTETWTSKSNICQLIISIQGKLVPLLSQNALTLNTLISPPCFYPNYSVIVHFIFYLDWPTISGAYIGRHQWFCGTSRGL